MIPLLDWPSRLIAPFSPPQFCSSPWKPLPSTGPFSFVILKLKFLFSSPPTGTGPTGYSDPGRGDTLSASFIWCGFIFGPRGGLIFHGVFSLSPPLQVSSCCLPKTLSPGAAFLPTLFCWFDSKVLCPSYPADATDRGLSVFLPPLILFIRPSLLLPLLGPHLVCVPSALSFTGKSAPLSFFLLRDVGIFYRADRPMPPFPFHETQQKANSFRCLSIPVCDAFFFFFLFLICGEY